MKSTKKAKLKAAGWKVGSTASFLELTPEEAAIIELKLTLAEKIKECRVHEHLTQTQVAGIIKSSQSRVAKMENGDPSVSLELLLRCLFALGASPKELAKIIRSLTLTTA